MDERDDLAIKIQLDEITKKIDRIVQTIESNDPGRQENDRPTEDG